MALGLYLALCALGAGFAAVHLSLCVLLLAQGLRTAALGFLLPPMAPWLGRRHRPLAVLWGLLLLAWASGWLLARF